MADTGAQSYVVIRAYAVGHQGIMGRDGAWSTICVLLQCNPRYRELPLPSARSCRQSTCDRLSTILCIYRTVVGFLRAHSRKSGG